MGFSPSAPSRGYCLVVIRELLIVAAFLVEERSLQGMRASVAVVR